MTVITSGCTLSPRRALYECSLSVKGMRKLFVAISNVAAPWVWLSGYSDSDSYRDCSHDCVHSLPTTHYQQWCSLLVFWPWGKGPPTTIIITLTECCGRDAEEKGRRHSRYMNFTPTYLHRVNHTHTHTHTATSSCRYSSPWRFWAWM